MLEPDRPTDGNKIRRKYFSCSITKRPFVGLTALLPCGILYSYPNEFLHTSPEALHTPSGVRDLC
jgi:hypothetical protein